MAGFVTWKGIIEKDALISFIAFSILTYTTRRKPRCDLEKTNMEWSPVEKGVLFQTTSTTSKKAMSFYFRTTSKSYQCIFFILMLCLELTIPFLS